MRIWVLSLAYRFVRWSFLCLFGCTKTGPNLEPMIEKGDRLLDTVFPLLRYLTFSFRPNHQLATTVHDLDFRSPVLFSSFKDDLTMIQLWLSMGAGGGFFKTIMAESREGNPQPRIQEVRVDGKVGLLNAMGLPGKGIDDLLKRVTHAKVGRYGAPVGFSIGGANLDEYVDVLQKIESQADRIPVSFFYELNVSCPNTEEGQDMMKHLPLLTDLLTQLRQKTDRVISVKLSPDLKNQKLLKIVEAIRPFSKMMVNIGNTQFKTPSEVGLSGQHFSMPGGGFSGPSLLPRTLEMVSLLAPLGVPIIATGGISTVQDVREAQSRGAVLCGMATALVQDPYCIPRINRALLK